MSELLAEVERWKGAAEKSERNTRRTRRNRRSARRRSSRTRTRVPKSAREAAAAAAAEAEALRGAERRAESACDARAPPPNGELRNLKSEFEEAKRAVETASEDVREHKRRAEEAIEVAAAAAGAVERGDEKSEGELREARRAAAAAAEEAAATITEAAGKLVDAKICARGFKRAIGEKDVELRCLRRTRRRERRRVEVRRRAAAAANRMREMETEACEARMYAAACAVCAAVSLVQTYQRDCVLETARRRRATEAKRARKRIRR